MYKGRIEMSRYLLRSSLLPYLWMDLTFDILNMLGNLPSEKPLIIYDKNNHMTNCF